MVIGADNLIINNEQIVNFLSLLLEIYGSLELDFTRGITQFPSHSPTLSLVTIH
jgi:hypothetical protein